MGIIIALVYIPAYFIVSGLSVFMAKKVSLDPVEVEKLNNFHAIVALSFLGTISGVILFLLQVPVRGNTDWDAFFLKLAVTLIGPLCIGVVAFIASLMSAEKPKLWLRSISVGAFISVPVFPWVALFIVGD